MSKKTFLAVIFLGLFLSASVVNAAPVGNPSSPRDLNGKVWSSKEGKFALGVGIEADVLSEKELENNNGEIEANFYTFKVLTSYNERVSFYAKIGEMQDIEYSFTVGGSDVTFNFEDGTTWTLGSTLLLYEWDNGVSLGADIKYRTLEETGYESVVIDNTTYEKSDVNADVEGEFEEWQIALGISKKMDYFVPYAGIKYNDYETTAKTTAGGSTYEGTADGDEEFGIFLGCSILPTENFSIDVEGRFIDEQAFTVGLSYMF